MVKIDDNVEVDFGSVMSALDDKYGVNTVYKDNPPDLIQCPAVITYQLTADMAHWHMTLVFQ